MIPVEIPREGEKYYTKLSPVCKTLDTTDLQDPTFTNSNHSITSTSRIVSAVGVSTFKRSLHTFTRNYLKTKDLENLLVYAECSKSMSATLGFNAGVSNPQFVLNLTSD